MKNNKGAENVSKGKYKKSMYYFETVRFGVSYQTYD